MADKLDQSPLSFGVDQNVLSESEVSPFCSTFPRGPTVRLSIFSLVFRNVFDFTNTYVRNSFKLSTTY